MSEAFVVLSLVSVWGCGGGSSGPKDIDTGLDEDLALQDVSASQAQSACQNLQEGIEGRFAALLTERRVCEMVGAFSATSPSECNTIADACVEQGAGGNVQEEIDVSEGLDCTSGASAFTGCSVTVGEYEDCLSAQFSQVETVFKSFSCANAGTLDMDNLDVGAMLSTPASVPACDRLAAECPAASPFGGSEEL